MKKTEILKIIERMKKSLKPDGIIFISYFNTDDSSYKRFKNSHPEAEKNTFFANSTKQYWNFMEKGELKEIFSRPKDEFKAIFYKERKVKDLKPQVHYHGISEVVTKKVPSK